MVLEDVADRPRPLVEAGPALDPHRLRDGDLDVVDELAVPDGLEDAVREPQRQHVLHGLLAEVVVDPEDLLLAEPAMQELAQAVRRGRVVPERLLDDDARPALVILPLADLPDARLERLRRDRQVVDAVAGKPLARLELGEDAVQVVLGALVCEVRRDIAETVRQAVPDGLAEGVAARVAAPRASSRPRTGPSSARSGRRRRRRTAPAAGGGRRGRTAPGRACAASGRPTRRRSRAHRDPACAASRDLPRAGSRGRSLSLRRPRGASSRCPRAARRTSRRTSARLPARASPRRPGSRPRPSPARRAATPPRRPAA